MNMQTGFTKINHWDQSKLLDIIEESIKAEWITFILDGDNTAHFIEHLIG